MKKELCSWGIQLLRNGQNFIQATLKIDLISTEILGGQTTPQMLIRFKQDVVDLMPTVVVILAGTNDIAGNTGPSNVKMITDNIFSMATIATANDIQVVLSSVLPVLHRYEWSPEIVDPPSTIDALNECLKEFAESNGFYYLDYFSEMVDNRKGLKKEFTNPDGVHPNEKGYELMLAGGYS